MRLPGTGTGAERSRGGGGGLGAGGGGGGWWHAKELEKCLVCFRCWGELGKVPLLEMQDLGPSSSLPSSSVSLHLVFMVGKASGLRRCS